MSNTGQLPELESLRSQVADLARELAARDQTLQAQRQDIDDELQDLRKQSDLLRAIMEGTAADTGDDFFASLATHLTSTLRMQYAIIGEILDGTPARIRTVAVSSGGHPLDNFEYDLTQAPCGTGLTESFWCFERGIQALFPNFPPLVAMGVESHSGVSVRDKQGKVVGLIVVMDTKPIESQDRLRALLQVFAPRVAAELQRKQAEAALQVQTRQLAHALALAHLGSWEWDIDTGAATWSDEQFRIFGHEPGAIAVTYDTFLAALLPDDHDHVLAAVNDALLGKHPLDVDCRIVRPTGEVRTIHCRGEMTRNDSGHPLRMSGTILDITERTQVEEALRTSEERWHLAVRGSDDGIWDWNIQSGDIFFSSRWKAMRGFADHEVRNHIDEWRSRIHPDDLDRVLQSIDRYLARQTPGFYEEYRVQRKDGSYMWILDRGVALWNEDGTPIRMVGSESDISEHKQALLRLAQQTSLLRSILAAEPECIKRVAADGTLLEMNKAGLCFIESDSFEEVAGRSVYDLVAPEFLERFRNMHEAVIQGASQQLEFQIVGLKGTRRWMETHAVPLRNPIDHRVEQLAITRDISERKRTEAVRDELLARLKKISSQVPGVVYQFKLRPDGSSCFPYASERIREIYRVSPEEVREDASKVFAIFHPEDYAGVVASITNSAETMQPWQYEYRVKFLDGTVRWLYGNSVPQKETDGSTLWHGFITDITDRKRAEQALEHLVEGTASVTGEAFFPALVQQLASALDVPFALVTELADRSRTRLRTLAMWKRDGPGQHFEYDTRGTPCEIVLAQGSAYYPAGVRALFPGDQDLVELEAEGYLGHALRDSQGEPIGHLCVLTNTSFQVGAQALPMMAVFAARAAAELERKRANEKLHQRLELEKLLATVSTDFISLGPREIDNGINGALARIGRFLDVDRSYVFWFSDDGTTMSNTHEWCAADVTSEMAALHHLPVETFPWWMERMKRFEPISIPCVADLPAEAGAERAILQAQAIQSLVVVPMTKEAALVGFIGFDSVRTPRTWPEEDITLLRLLGEMFANAREHRRAEEKRAQLAQDIQLLLDSTGEGIWGVDLETRCTFLNKAAGRMLGYAAEETLGRNMHQLVHHSRPDGSPYPIDECPIVRSFRTGQGCRVENDTLWRRDGTSFPAEYSSFPILENGTAKGAVVTFQDITERKRAEDEQKKLLTELAESRKHFEQIFHWTPSAVAISTLAEGRFLDVNDRLVRLTGYSREELIGHTTAELKLWADPPERTRVIQQILERGSLHNQEGLLRTKTGDIRPIMVSVDRILVNATPCLIYVAHDITERKQAEALLQAQKQVLELVASGAPLRETLDTLVRIIEAQSSGMLGSILFLDEEGRHLRHGASPGLPDDYTGAIDGAAIGPSAGSCGTAAFRREPVIVEDIATDPLWADYRHLALPHGLRACWSTPIASKDMSVLGTFAMYYREPRRPSPQDLRLIEHATRLAAIAIERKRSEDVLAERVRLATFAAEISAILNHRQSIEEMLDQCAGLVVEHVGAAFAGVWTAESGDLCGECVNTGLCGDRNRCLHVKGSAGLATNLHDEHRRVPVGAQHIGQVLQGKRAMSANDILHDERFPNKDWIRENGLQSFAGFPLYVTDKVFGVLAVFARSPLSHATLQTLESVANGIAAAITRKQVEDALRLTKFSVDRAADAVYWIDAHARILDVNDAASAMLGYSKHELCAMTVHDLNPDFQADMWPDFWAETQRRRTMAFETLHRTKNGRSIPIEVSVNYLSHEGRDYHCAFVRDISERKKAEAALRNNERQLRTVLDTLPVGVWFTDHAGKVLLSNPAGRQIWAGVQQVGLTPGPDQRGWWEQAGPSVEPHRWALARALTKGERALNETLEIESLDGSRKTVRNSAVPVRSETGEIVGAIVLNEDITALRRAQEALKLTQFSVDHAVEGFFWIGPNAGILHVNEAACRMLEYSREELTAMTLHDLDPAFPPEAWPAHWEELKRKGSLTFESQQWSKTGRVLDVEVTVNYLCYDGQEYNCAIVRDISERKRAEAALRISEARFRLLVEGAPVGIAIMDRQKRYVKVNQAFCHLVGYREEELLGQTFALFTHPDDLVSNVEQADALFGASSPGSCVEKRYIRKTGETIWATVNATSLALPRDHEQHIIAIIEDTTDKKRSEQALRESRTRLTEAQRIAHIGSWELNAVDQHLTWSEEAHRILETDHQRFAASYDAFLALVHPEDRDLVHRTYTTSIANRIPYDIVHRVLLPDGRIKFVRERCETFYDREGHPLRSLGTIQDITEQRQVEETLRQHEQDLRHAMDERERISQDLHDGILQSLYAIGLGLEACKSQQQRKKTANAITQALDQAVGQLNTVMAEVRNFIAGLESQILQGSTFPMALRTMVLTLTADHPIPCALTIDESLADTFSTEQALHLLNVVREALSNSLRHAGATKTTVSLKSRSRSIRLTIADNGIGFEPASMRGVGHGLTNMAARARKVGGRFAIKSVPQRGTRITIDLPKEAGHAESEREHGSTAARR